MPYRDDEEGRKAHIEALEARIAELEGENAQLIIGAERPEDTLFGRSLTVTASDEVRGVLRKKELRTFLDRADMVVGITGKHVAGDGVAVWRADARDLDVTVRTEGNGMILRVSERIGLLTGAMIGGIFGGAGGVVALVMLFATRYGGWPVALIAIPIWSAIMYGVARLVFARHVRSKQREVDTYVRGLVARLPARIED